MRKSWGILNCIEQGLCKDKQDLHSPVHNQLGESYICAWSATTLNHNTRHTCHTETIDILREQSKRIKTKPQEQPLCSVESLLLTLQKQRQSLWGGLAWAPHVSKQLLYYTRDLWGHSPSSREQRPWPQGQKRYMGGQAGPLRVPVLFALRR